MATLVVVAASLAALWFSRGAGRGPLALTGREAAAGAPVPGPAVLRPAVQDAEAALAPSVDTAGERRPAAAPGARSVHGRALEATTGQPLGEAFALDLRADGRKERVALDAAGRFRGETAFAPGEVLAGLYERHEGWPLAGVRFEQVAEDGEVELRFGVGLLVHLAVAFPRDERPSSMRARVLVTAPGDEPAREWDWDTLRPMPDACVHYKNPPEVADARATVALEVEAVGQGETWRGRVALPAARGVLGPLPVTLVADTSVAGRVVDTRGEPIDEVTVLLFPEDGRAQEDGGGRILRTETALGGRFGFERIDPGRYRLSLHHGLTAAAPLSIVLERGRNSLGDLRLDVPPGESFVRGRVVAGKEGLPFVTLLLTDTSSGVQWVTGSDFPLFSSQREMGGFSFESVPPGEYELRPADSLGRVFEPERIRVSPPVEGLLFEADPEVPPQAVQIEARDARTGLPFDRLQYAFRTEGMWFGGQGLKCGEPQPAIGDRWILWATGTRPVRLERPPDERFERVTVKGESARLARIEVALEPGWTRAVVAIDGDTSQAAMPGEYEPYYGRRLAGVEVSAAGRRLGETGGDGLALIVRDEDPGRLAFHLPGWHVLVVRPLGEFVMVVLGRG